MAEVAIACPSCNSPVAAAHASAAKAAAVADNVREAWGSALGALKSFAADPVGRLPVTYAALGDAQAGKVGISYGIASLVLFLLGGYLLLPFRDGLWDFLGFGGFLKCILFGVLPFGGTVLGSLCVRKALRAQGGLGGDLFLSGAALLPISLAMPVNGLLGYENYAAMAVLTLFAASTGVLMLFSGFSRISQLSERAATLAVPIVVVLVIWLGKTTASSVLGGGDPMGSMGMGGAAELPMFEGWDG
jgi:hypothetical protein